MRKVILVFTLLLTLCEAAKAQNCTEVSGFVHDIAGEPLIGAIIRYQNGTCLTVTDVEGKFRIPQAKPGLYTVSYVGFESYTFKVLSIAAKSWFNITLKEFFYITPADLSLW